MELTLEMLTDHLQKHGIDVHLVQRRLKKRAFRDVRRAPAGGEGPWEEGFLYCGAAAPPAGAPAFFLLPAAAGQGFAGDALVCGADAETLFALAQDCFLAYREWMARLGACVLGGGTLKELIALARPVFQNPISVDDPGFRLLAYSEGYDRELGDEESLFVAENGYHSPRYVERMVDDPVFLHNLEHGTGPFLYHYDFLQHSSIYCPLRGRDGLVGFLTIVGRQDNFTPGMVDAAALFAGMLGAVLSRPAAPLRPDDTILLEALRGRPVEQKLLDVCLEKLPPDGGAGYSVVRLEFCATQEKNRFLLARVEELLAGHLPQSKVLQDGGGLTVLVSEKRAPAKELSAFLSGLALANHFRAGFSLPFADFTLLHTAYAQARAAIQWGARLQKGQAVFKYGGVLFYDILSRCLTEAERKSLCAPALETLRLHDAQRGTELSRTLRVWLQAGGQSSAAAAALHLHKNSLYYRVAQISELTGLDLKDFAVCERLRLSLYLEDLARL